MSEIDAVSRRSLFRIVTASVVGGAIEIPPALAQHLHSAVAEVKSLSAGAGYKPQAFTAHEYATLKKLADIIIPGDEHSGNASDAGAPEFIDLLCARSSELAATYRGGFTWLDEFMTSRYGADFLRARPEQQTAMLDALAWTKNVTPETAYGVPFWTTLRNMVVDAFYTSPAGIADIGYLGNKAVSRFEVPEEAVRYAIERSPFAGSR